MIEALHLAQALARVAVGNVDPRGAQARGAQRAQHPRRIAAPDRRNGDHHGAPRAGRRGDARPEPRERARADLDRVRAVAELDRHAAQRAAGGGGCSLRVRHARSIKRSAAEDEASARRARPTRPIPRTRDQLAAGTCGLHDARAHEDQQLLAVVADFVAAEQRAEERQPGQVRHRRAGLGAIDHVDAAEHERLAVLHQRLGLSPGSWRCRACRRASRRSRPARSGSP